MLLAPASPAETTVVVPWMRHQLVGRNADRRAVRDRCARAGRSGPASPACRRRPSHAARGRRAIAASIASTTPKRMPMSRWPRRFWLGSSTLAALDQQVELVVRRHHGPGAGAPGCGGENGAVRNEAAAGRVHWVSLGLLVPAIATGNMDDKPPSRSWISQDCLDTPPVRLPERSEISHVRHHRRACATRSSLGPKDRERLVDLLIDSLDEAPDPDVEEAWRVEIRRRVSAYERGESVLYDVEEVMAEAKRLAP